MIKPCPHCGEQPEDIEWVEIIAELETMDPGMEEDPGLSSMDLPETTTCRRYQPCGHAFSMESLETIAGELSELRQLRRELRTVENPVRYKNLTEYAIPAQKNTIRNAKQDIDRIKWVEQIDDD